MAKRTTLSGIWQSFRYNVLGWDKAAPESFTYNMFGNGVTEYDITKTQELVEKGYLTNPHVFAVINELITSGMQVPWLVYEVKDQKAFKRYINFKQAGDMDAAYEYEHKAVDIFQGKNELTKLIESPNQHQTFDEFHATNFGNKLLTGESFVYGVGTGLKTMPGLLEMIPLPSQNIHLMVTNQWYGEIEKYILILESENGVSFDPSEIMHVKNFNPSLLSSITANKTRVTTLGLRGIPPLAPLCKVIQQSNESFTAQMRIIQNGHPLGILSNNSSEPMTDSEWENASGNMQSSYGGSGNKGKIKLTTANLKWLNMGFNSVDLALLPVQEMSLGAICAAYQLPVPNLTGENANFNTGKESEKKKWNDAILPHFNSFANQYNKFFRKRIPNLKEGVFIDYDHRSVPSLQQDLEKYTKIILSQMQHGLLNGETANRMLYNDVEVAEHHKKYLLSNQLRFSDQLPPGQTGVGDNNQKND